MAYEKYIDTYLTVCDKDEGKVYCIDVWRSLRAEEAIVVGEIDPETDFCKENPVGVAKYSADRFYIDFEDKSLVYYTPSTDSYTSGISVEYIPTGLDYLSDSLYYTSTTENKIYKVPIAGGAATDSFVIKSGIDPETGEYAEYENYNPGGIGFDYNNRMWTCSTNTEIGMVSEIKYTGVEKHWGVVTFEDTVRSPSTGNLLSINGQGALSSTLDGEEQMEYKRLWICSELDIDELYLISKGIDITESPIGEIIIAYQKERTA